MFFYKFVAEHQLLSFIVLNFLLIDVLQMISIARRGWGQIVSLAGYYGDRALVLMILFLSNTLYTHKVTFEITTTWSIILIGVIYVVSVVVAQKYLPPPVIEDWYHNIIVLPAYVIILTIGGVSALWYGSWFERLGALTCIIGWFVLLIVDIKKDRLNQKKFMVNLGLKEENY